MYIRSEVVFVFDSRDFIRKCCNFLYSPSGIHKLIIEYIIEFFNEFNVKFIFREFDKPIMLKDIKLYGDHLPDGNIKETRAISFDYKNDIIEIVYFDGSIAIISNKNKSGYYIHYSYKGDISTDILKVILTHIGYQNLSNLVDKFRCWYKKKNLEHLIVDNYKCFKHPFVLENLSKVNVFVGNPDTGKSTILSLVRQKFRWINMKTSECFVYPGVINLTNFTGGRSILNYLLKKIRGGKCDKYLDSEERICYKYILDNPEMGLHPKLINILANSIVHVAQQNEYKQFFIATHSIDLIKNIIYHSKKKKFEDLAVFYFVKLKDGKLDFNRYDFKQLYAMTLDNIEKFLQ